MYQCADCVCCVLGAFLELQPRLLGHGLLEPVQYVQGDVFLQRTELVRMLIQVDPIIYWRLLHGEASGGVVSRPSMLADLRRIGESTLARLMM